MTATNGSAKHYPSMDGLEDGDEAQSSITNGICRDNRSAAGISSEGSARVISKTDQDIIRIIGQHLRYLGLKSVQILLFSSQFFMQ